MICPARLRRSAVLLLLAICAGCGSSAPQYAEVPSVKEITPADNVRTFLTGLSESGQIDSGAMILKENLELMKTGGANVDELLKDADELVKMPSGARAKAKAKEMLDKLPL